MARKIGIDLGTTNTVVFIPKRGIVINEPSVVAVSVLDNKILAVGNSAKDMIGRTPDSIVVSRPLIDGAIADYRVTTAMIRYFIKKASGLMSFMKPEVLVSVPAGITSTEKRALIEATLNAGASAVYLVKEPVRRVRWSARAQAWSSPIGCAPRLELCPHRDTTPRPPASSPGKMMLLNSSEHFVRHLTSIHCDCKSWATNANMDPRRLSPCGRDSVSMVCPEAPEKAQD